MVKALGLPELKEVRFDCEPAGKAVLSPPKKTQKAPSSLSFRPASHFARFAALRVYIIHIVA
jgi:hypothetical protein